MFYTSEKGLTSEEIKSAVKASVEGKKLKKVLLLPPILRECIPAPEN